MANVGEVKALLAEVVQRCGEAWQAAEAEKYNLGGAIEQAHQAAEIAAMTYEGTQHESALAAVSLLNKAEADGHASYAMIEGMQEAILAASEQAQQYMGILG